jgi:dTDP-4-dehydrorhamnose 3,5-epimerase
MKVTLLDIPDVLLIEPVVHEDDRGWFVESFHIDRYTAAGIAGPFVQDNLSRSRRGVLRGLHYQDPFPQGKLVQVLEGEVFDVAVDIRPGSATYGRWVGAYLSADNRRQLWVPPGFAHGFQATAQWATVAYKCTEYYRPDAERVLAWNDPALAIQWPIPAAVLSPKDRDAMVLLSLPAS